MWQWLSTKRSNKTAYYAQIYFHINLSIIIHNNIASFQDHHITHNASHNSHKTTLHIQQYSSHQYQHLQSEEENKHPSRNMDHTP
mmetsp:Transcript_18676/g.29285  ORF Transcript_18676/g.29285 Transcript_18676/m.29285 type:complete len:85 (-) Transcript_18676:431-685(-)